MASINGFSLRFLVCLLCTKTVIAEFMPNINCGLRMTVVPTSLDASYRYYPYFVSLSRCQGSQGRTPPALVECVPAEVETVNVEVRQLQSTDAPNARGAPNVQNKMYVPLTNHTKCKVQCAFKREDCKAPNVYDERNCRCICNLGLIGPAGMICRDPRKIWSSVACGCMCKNTRPCKNRRQYFDQNSCSCKCKRRRAATKGCVYYGENYDALTCSCIKKARRVKQNQNTNQDGNDEKDTGFWLGAAAVEFLVMLFAFDIFLYKHQAGLSFTIKSKISSVDKPRSSESDGLSEDALEPTKYRLTFREILRRQSRVSSSLRRRSSTYSNACAGPQTPLITSPSQNNIAEDVFFQD